MQNVCLTLSIFFCSLLLGVQTQVTEYPISDPYWIFLDKIKWFNSKQEEVQEIENKHLKEDMGFKAAIKYFQSDEWKRVADSLLNHPLYKKFVAIFYKINIDFNLIVVCIGEHINSIEITDEELTSKPDLEAFQRVIGNVFRIPETFSLEYITKILEREDYQKIIRVLNTEENKKTANEFPKLKEFTEMAKILKEMSCEILDYMLYIYKMCGWIDPAATSFS